MMSASKLFFFPKKAFHKLRGKEEGGNVHEGCAHRFKHCNCRSDGSLTAR